MNQTKEQKEGESRHTSGASTPRHVSSIHIRSWIIPSCWIESTHVKQIYNRVREENKQEYLLLT